MAVAVDRQNHVSDVQAVACRGNKVLGAGKCHARGAEVVGQGGEIGRNCSWRTLWTGRAGRTSGSSGTGWTSGAGWTGWTSGAGRAGGALRAVWTGWTLRSCGTLDIPNDEAFVRSAVSGGWYDTGTAILNVVAGDDYGWRRRVGSHGCGEARSRDIAAVAKYFGSCIGGPFASALAGKPKSPRDYTCRSKNARSGSAAGSPHSKLSSTPRPARKGRPIQTRMS